MQHANNAYRVFDTYEGREHGPRPIDGQATHDETSRSSRPSLGAIAARRLDDSAVRAMERVFQSSDRTTDLAHARRRLDEARGIYATKALGEDITRFFPEVADPSEMRVRPLKPLKGGRRLRVTWRSTYEVYDRRYAPTYEAYSGNEISQVRLLVHDDPAPLTMIYIHPWAGGMLRMEEEIIAARSFYRMGSNVALFTLPFHGGRTPRQASFSGHLFPSRSLQRTNEGFGQAVADLRVLIRWLRAEHGCDAIGLAGISLGGYTTALMACLEPDLAFAIPIVAPSSLADMVWSHGQGRPGLREAKEAGVTLRDIRALWSVHCPLAHPPVVPWERRFMVWGQADRIVPSVHQLALWEHWQRPALHTFRGGHLLQIGRRGYLQAIRHWLRATGLAPQSRRPKKP